jgi:hypothetical protein
MLFPIRVDTWHRPLLALFGVRRDRAYVALDDDGIYVRFGFWRHRFPRANLVGARNAGRVLRYGLGWHADFVGSLCINGSFDGMVELTFDPPERFRLLLLPGRCKRLYVSLEDPEGFLRALERARPSSEDQPIDV